MHRAAKSGGGGTPVINVIISASASAAISVFTLAGSPSYICKIRVTVNTGVNCQAGLNITGFNALSKATLINNGNIYGIGGDAGGFPNFYSVGSSQGTFNPGTDPTQAGHAVNTTLAITIDNTNGNIYSGGGGGGYGDVEPDAVNNPRTNDGIAAGGGGGGQGFNNASGAGAAGASLSSGATNGGSGSSTGPGAGGNGGTYVGPTQIGGTGGSGGSWGQDGVIGGNSTHGIAGGRSGGLAGNAVKLNGKSIIWLAGNNTSQVKGYVS